MNKKLSIKTSKLILFTFIIFQIFCIYLNAQGDITKYPASAELRFAIKSIRQTNPKSQNLVRIMSFNLLADSLGFEGTPARTRADGVCSLINSLAPDVVGLQETSRTWYSCIIQNTDYAFVSPLRTQISGSMTSIIYNPETLVLTDYGEKALKYGGDSRLRKVIWATFREKLSKKTFTVINTHFSLSEDNTPVPMRQATELLDFINELSGEPNNPLFFIGDFNALERTTVSYASSSVYETLCTSLTDTKYNSENISCGVKKSIYSSAVDHIFLKGNAKIKNFVILSQKEFSFLSDHYPIFIDTAL